MTSTAPAPPDSQNLADNLVLRIMLSPEGRADPYPLYRELREIAPVHRSGMGPAWFLTRYDDCRTMLRDPRFGKAEPDDDNGAMGAFFSSMGPAAEETALTQRRSMLALNPPDHTRLRGLVSRGFTPKRVHDLRPAIEAMTDHVIGLMIDAADADGEVEVLGTLGFPLPVKVIGELVGVPEADRDMFRPLVRTVAASLEPGTTPEMLRDSMDAAAELQEYFRNLIAVRTADPQDDLTSVLISAHEDGDRLTEDEMVATLILIFAAGFETTTNLIGNGLLTLLQHPDQLRRLRADPSLLPAAVEEILRYQSPVQADGRRCMQDATLAGHDIAKGEWVITFLGAANRDPLVWDDPERFDIRPRETQVMSFASGIHYCLGAALARLEGEVVFGKLLERLPSIELVEEPTWRNTLILRGLDELKVRIA
jgi:cytochrome P450